MNRPKSHPSPSTRPAQVQLVVASGQLRTECVDAAEKLGFAVPCPTRVPAVGGNPLSCPPPVDAAATPCVGEEGEVGYSVFFLDFSGFAVPEGYVGIDGKAMGHVFIEARRHTQSPPRPCIGATYLGRVGAGQWSTTAYDCSNDALTVERIATHGEGAYVGHVLLNWSKDGIDYIASAHGQTTVNRALLVGLVRSMTLTAPK